MQKHHAKSKMGAEVCRGRFGLKNGGGGGAISSV